MTNARFIRNAEPGRKEKSATVVGAIVLWITENEPGGEILTTSEMVAYTRRYLNRLSLVIKDLSWYLNKRKPGHV